MTTIQEGKRARVAHVTKSAASTAGWQMLKSPLYLWRVIMHSCRGALYTFVPLVTFMWAGDKRTAAQQKLATGHADAYDKLHTKWWHAVVLRSTLVLGPPGFVLVALGNVVGRWAFVILGTVSTAVLAFIGSRLVGETITDPTPPKRRDLTQDRLDATFRALGLLKKPKDDDTYASELEIRELPKSVDGGTLIQASLPPGTGKTASHVIAKREEIAAELGVSTPQVVIEKDRGSAGAFSLWLADTDPFDCYACPSPYIQGERTSVFDGFRIGVNPRGKVVTVPMMNGSTLVGGLPGQGKTTIGRCGASAIALDPYCDVVLIDPKASADWRALVQLCARAVRGAGPEQVKEAIETLEDLVRTMTQRYLDLEDVSASGSVTRELAAQKRFRPIACLMDELQALLMAADGKQRSKLASLMTQITNMGRQAGIYVIALTQRPSAQSVPSDFRGSVGQRIAARCADPDSSDIVLGEGAAKNGADASLLPEVVEGQKEPAQAIVRRGAGADEHVMVDWISLEDFAAICARGVELRNEAGTLRDEEEQQAVNLLDFVIRELEKQDGLTSTEIIARIPDYKTDKPLTPTSFGIKMKQAGVKPDNRRRYLLADVRRAF
jgi:S-DNA-T family DNA segregation ATPase FtsK/SpoIIIE